MLFLTSTLERVALRSSLRPLSTAAKAPKEPLVLVKNVNRVRTLTMNDPKKVSDPRRIQDVSCAKPEHLEP